MVDIHEQQGGDSDVSLIDSGHVIFGMIVDMLQACVRRTGKKAVAMIITPAMAEILWDYGERERGGWDYGEEEPKSKKAWLQGMRRGPTDSGELTRLLGTPVRLGSDFEVIERP